MKRTKLLIGFVCVLSLTTLVVNGVNAQRSRSKKSYEEKLWDYLEDSKYQNWAPVPGKSDAAYEGESPHGAYLKMYLNRRAAGNPNELPDGSIIIKENYGSDKTTLLAVTVMLKSKGFNSSGGDWFWAKYDAKGRIETAKNDDGDDKKIAGKVSKCIECHADSKGEDYVFFNDE